MPQLYWQTQLMYDGDQKTFSFPDTVEQSTAGIAGFQLSYPDYSHRVEALGVSLDVSQLSDQEISVGLSLTLEDSAGNTLDPAHSWAYVTVVAWTGSEHLAYLDQSAIQQTLQCPNNVSFAGTALQSFQLSAPEGERIINIDARVGAMHHGREISVAGAAQFRGTREPGHDENLTAGVLASLEGNQFFEMQIAQLPGRSATHDGHDNQTTSPVHFSFTPAAATALLTGFDVAMDAGSPGRFVSCFKAGAMSYDGQGYEGPSSAVRIDGNAVSVTTNVSLYQDAQISHQSTLNRATLLVIASPHAGSEVGGPAGTAISASQVVPRGEEMADNYTASKADDEVAS